MREEILSTLEQLERQEAGDVEKRLQVISYLRSVAADRQAELRKHGVQLEDAVPAIGGGMLRSFYDPEGNMLQIVQRDNG